MLRWHFLKTTKKSKLIINVKFRIIVTYRRWEQSRVHRGFLEIGKVLCVRPGERHRSV